MVTIVYYLHAFGQLMVTMMFYLQAFGELMVTIVYYLHAFGQLMVTIMYYLQAFGQLFGGSYSATAVGTQPPGKGPKVRKTQVSCSP